MDAIENINGSHHRDQRVGQQAQKKNRFGKLMPFNVFLAKRGKFGFGKKIPLKKAISETIWGDFENSAIEDAIYCIMPANADGNEKQIVANDLASKLISMSRYGDVILLAASVQ